MEKTNTDSSESRKGDLLKETGRRIKILDNHLIRVIGHRFKLANLVSDAKDGGPIIARQREQERLDYAAEVANEIGMEPDLARSIIYQIIGAGIKHQTELRDLRDQNTGEFKPNDRSPEALRRNLLTLTERVAGSYDKHQNDCPATSLNYEFEDLVIEDLISGVRSDPNKLFLDLGTATGRMAFRHGFNFERVVGIDISDSMLDVARSKLKPSSAWKFDFQNADLEFGIPLKDESVSVVVMNNGTASDISNITGLIQEVSRVLVKGGVAYFSFYNKSALVHESILPWQNSIGAIFNPVFDTLEVEIDGLRGVIPIFAKPVTVDEAKNLADRHLSVTKILTYPFITSILPREFISLEVCKDIIQFDKKLALGGDERGAYIIVVARKN